MLLTFQEGADAILFGGLWFLSDCYDDVLGLPALSAQRLVFITDKVYQSRMVPQKYVHCNIE